MQTTIHSLHDLPWTVTGYNPYEWKLGRSLESGMELSGEIRPVPAPVPGSVQQALLDAQLIPDWNIGLKARESEWVENRHWVYHTKLPADITASEGHHTLVCKGLDYQGQILINHESIYTFDNSFIPHRIDLTPHLREGENDLIIVFECSPRWLGQFGYTSEMKEWKPRFNFFWDWTSRLVQIGIWDDIYIESATESLEDLSVRTICRGDYRGIHLSAEGNFAHNRNVLMELSDQSGKLLFSTQFPAHLLRRDGHTVDLSDLKGDLQLWYPNNLGEQPLYTADISLHDSGNENVIFHSEVFTIGFKEVTWKQNPGCREDADPWWCHVNGTPLFIQGANWTPIRPNFADVTEGHYRELLNLYKDLGFNLLRVWGGAVLEKECFYDICDELGLMVWQEFPLSSSGLDNCPPDDPRSVVELGQIAKSYIKRRMHHASHIIWCGGNELRRERDTNTPIDLSHPVMQQFKMMVDQLDPDKRFVTSTPSGPSFGANMNDYGKGIHWAVNGPWRTSGKLEENWIEYWAKDDSLLRSETGLPGPASVELIRKYNDADDVYPCSNDNPVWRRQSWWVEWDQFTAEHDREAESLEEYVAWGQERQRQGLVHAAQCSKNRYPNCGGIIFWMGHDSFPCTANTSLIDFDGKLKPAAKDIGKIFREPV